MSLAELIAKRTQLLQRQAALEGTLRTYEEELRALRETALKEYGTSDPVELRARLEADEAANQTALLAFQKALAEAEEALRQVG